MYDANQSITERSRQEEFLKLKILEAFNLFAVSKKGFVEKKEIPYIMRYLGQFPSEAQVSEAILPQIEDDEPSDFIKYQKFEPYMLNGIAAFIMNLVLKEKEFDPEDTETLLAAFRTLDQENKGYIDKDMMTTFLEKQGIPFHAKETESFNKFVAPTNKDQIADRVYYEDYVLRLQAVVEKHMESVMKGYSTFQTSKKIP